MRFGLANLRLRHVVRLLAIVGGLLVFAGLMSPIYTVGAGVAEEAFMAWCVADETGTHRPSAVAAEAYHAMFGHRYLLIDLGSGLLSIAASLVVLTALAPAARQGRTPDRIWRYFVIGVVGIGWLFAGAIYAIFVDFERRMLPWCADSIGIPLMGLSFMLPIVLVVCVIAGLVVATMFRSMGGPLVPQTDRHFVVSSNLTFVVVALLGFGLLSMAMMATTAESVAIGSIVLFGYLVLCVRANILSSPQEEP